MSATSPDAAFLKRATPSDIDRLTPLVEAYHAFEGIELAPEARRAGLLRLLSEPALGAVWFILPGAARAEAAAPPIGYVALCLGYSIEFAGIDAFVDELFLVEPARGRGLGGRVLDLLAREAARLEIRALHLEVDRENARARRLYGAKGYEPRERFMLMSRRL